MLCGALCDSPERRTAEEHEARVRQASAEQLDILAEKILSATSIEELLGD